ncbi:MAG: NAD(P)/FAD-dependent oxidoreductase [Acidobacteria bacterium]|nr:NAD(P)/FAD-dependent oxidoreductase [Acidobacteriota bacterium]
MKKAFDLVVIGTGSAASLAASRCRAAGWTVAIIDSRPFGGTCALRGCDPKKVLVGAAEAIDGIRRLDGKGIDPAGARIDWPALMAFKRSLIEAVPRSRAEGFARAGIEAFHGRARFISPTTVAVGLDEMTGRRVLVASGAKPADLGIPGHEHLVTSEQFLELDDLPPRIVFVGGGYISFEFAHVAARAGAEVTIVHRGERPLELFDPDLVNLLAARTRALGIDLQLHTGVTAVERSRDGLVVHTSTGGAIQSALVVHGAGRVPEIDDLDLDSAGVAWDRRRGVAVNEYLQSVSNPAVYAAGDAAASGGPPLTPVAGSDGRIVATNLLEGNTATPDYSIVPSVLFTLPPLASVGLGEQAARERGLRFSVHHEGTSGWYSSRRIGEGASGFKVLIEEGSDRVLGAHLLGPHAEEVINLFALAMRAGMRAADLKSVLFGYPTSASDLPYML